VLGRLNPDYFLGGELQLDRQRAYAAVARLAERLGVGLEESAQAVVEVATENMANAIRLLCADRGLDYRRFDLEAFGGAGPLHAALLARRVGLGRVIVPPSPGLTSAFGAQAADLRVDRRMTRLLRSDDATGGELREAVELVAEETLSELRAEGSVRDPILLVTVSSRYRGQNFELEVTVPVGGLDDDLAVQMTERFHEEHERVYGYRLDGAVVEFVHLTATAIDRRTPLPPRRLDPGDLPDPVEVRPVYYKDERWVDTPIYRREALPGGAMVDGPAIIEEPDSTTLVLAGQTARVHETASLVLTEREPAPLAGSRSEGSLVGA
jgi:N-methylhydantoinase A